MDRERDMARTLKLISGGEPVMVWHAETALPAGTDLVVIPGGFSYGDYLRCGAIAARAPIMDAVRAHAGRGGLVLGVCNGFQIVCEAGLLPGVLMRKRSSSSSAATCICGSSAPTRRSPRLQRGAGDPGADRARRRQLRGRRRHDRAAGRRRAGARSAMRRRTAASIRSGTSTARPTRSPASSTSAATCSA